jgi:hypothetical protein
MPKVQIDGEEVISVEQAAIILNIGIATAWRRVNDKTLKSNKLLGRVFIKKSDLSAIEVKKE